MLNFTSNQTSIIMTSTTSPPNAYMTWPNFATALRHMQSEIQATNETGVLPVLDVTDQNQSVFARVTTGPELLVFSTENQTASTAPVTSRPGRGRKPLDTHGYDFGPKQYTGHGLYWMTLHTDGPRILLVPCITAVEQLINAASALANPHHPVDLSPVVALTSAEVSLGQGPDAVYLRLSISSNLDSIGTRMMVRAALREILRNLLDLQAGSAPGIAATHQLSGMVEHSQPRDSQQGSVTWRFCRSMRGRYQPQGMTAGEQPISRHRRPGSRHSGSSGPPASQEAGSTASQSSASRGNRAQTSQRLDGRRGCPLAQTCLALLSSISQGLP